MENLVLYSYFRSSASYRVRAALHLKQLPYITRAINLKSGEHLEPEFKLISSFTELPVLEHKGQRISQSMAIIQYLEDEFADSPALFPKTHLNKAKVLNICESINSGIHPLQNLKVGKKLKKDHGFSNDDVFSWHKHWITEGFLKLEALLKIYAGDFCFGDQIGAADLFLIPQVYNAIRYHVNMSQFPIIDGIYKKALTIKEIKLASPGFQPDTPEDLKETL